MSEQSPRVSHVVLDLKNGYAGTLRAGRHTLTADEARAHGGTETGPTPYDLVLSGLAACTAITLRMAAERKGWDLGEIHVDLELRKDPATKADHIARTVSFTKPLTEEQRARMADVVERTPVTKTIKAGATPSPRMPTRNASRLTRAISACRARTRRRW